MYNGLSASNRKAIRAMMGAAALGLATTIAVPAAADPLDCYYQPAAPCYTARGGSNYGGGGGSEIGITPVSHSFGMGGNGTFAYANSDNGGTVYAAAEMPAISDGYWATASLRQTLDISHNTGSVDSTVQMRIIAFGSHLTSGDGAGGQGAYIVEQQGQRVAYGAGYAGKNLPNTLFSIDRIVDVKPGIPINIFLQAMVSVNDRGGSVSVMVDPVYELVGEYASRYTINGLLTPSAAVPEPASWALLILGFGGIGGALRRRRAKGTSLAMSAI